jgi:hypothetical protein
MKRILIWTVIIVFVAFFIYVYRLHRTNPSTAEFLIRSVLSVGTLSAVLFALYGDYLREWLDPIKVRIEIPEEANTVLDNSRAHDCPVYCHHLRVVNKTPHKAIKDCRVWLKKVFVQNLAGDWKEEIASPVPRLMVWAPSEYSEDKRTFSTNQVLDFGMTLANNRGFEVTGWHKQGGTFQRAFKVGERVRFAFYVTADNYTGGEEFAFEVEVPSSVPNQKVTPSKVTAVSMV